MRTDEKLREKARKNGVPLTLLHKRIENGWEPEDAATRPRQARRDWKKLAQEAEKNDIPYRTMVYRIKEMDWPEEKAVTEPIQRRDKTDTVKWFGDREIPVDLIRRAETNGISYRHLYSRLKQGWEPERAASEPVKRYNRAGEMGIKGQTSIDEYIREKRKKQKQG